MQREYHKWYSPSLGRDMEQLVFGHAGAPVIIFPTSQGRFYENEDMGMINALADKIDGGHIQLYCVDSVDSDSWYNWHGSLEWRMDRANAYDAYLFYEVLPFINSRNSNGYVITTGCSFGAYHAVNFGFRHPERVHKIVALSGRYNLRHYFDPYYNEDLYYNSPLDYIGGAQEGEFLGRVRQQQINLLTGTWDLGVCQNETRQLNDLLNSKGINHTYEVWQDSGHDWPYWFKQIRQFI